MGTDDQRLIGMYLGFIIDNMRSIEHATGQMMCFLRYLE
jgi:hypothetical protein